MQSKIIVFKKLSIDVKSKLKFVYGMKILKKMVKPYLCFISNDFLINFKTYIKL